MGEAYDLRGKRVWVAGHRGMVGSALVRRLRHESCEIVVAGRGELDLRDQSETRRWLADRRPHLVFMAAARVGGILANASRPVDFLFDNLLIQSNVIGEAHRAGVEKLVFLGSSCIYPKFAEQPITEDMLLTGPLEPTNEWYAVAKIAGIKLCQAFRAQHGCDFISAMPCNLYGPGDNFDPDGSHVLAALMRKAHEAKGRGADDMVVWGTGTPRREFLHVDDCADALVHLAKVYSGDGHVNVGAGKDIAIGDLARMIMDIIGFGGRLSYDASKPDGTPRKLMSSAKLTQLGWTPTIRLRDGIAAVFDWFLNQSFATVGPGRRASA